MDFAPPEASQFRWGSFCLVLLGVERLSWRRQGLVSDESKISGPPKKKNGQHNKNCRKKQVTGRRPTRDRTKNTHTHIYIYIFKIHGLWPHNLDGIAWVNSKTDQSCARWHEATANQSGANFIAVKEGSGDGTASRSMSHELVRDEFLWQGPELLNKYVGEPVPKFCSGSENRVPHAHGLSSFSPFTCSMAIKWGPRRHSHFWTTSYFAGFISCSYFD